MADKNANIHINAKNNVAKGFRGASREVSSFQKHIKGFAGAIGGYLSSRAIISGANALITQLDDIGKASKRLGVTAEEYQKLTFAARRSGAANGDVERGFKRMASTIFDAQRGIKESVDSLDALGLKFQDLKGKSPERQFALLAQRLGAVDDASTKAALAQDLFGRAGTQLIPMLKDYNNLAAELQAKGAIISADNVRAAEKFKDQMEDLNVTVKALAANTGFIKWLSEVAAEFQAIGKSIPKDIQTDNNKGDTWAQKVAIPGAWLLSKIGLTKSSRQMGARDLERFRGNITTLKTGPANKQQIQKKKDDVQAARAAKAAAKAATERLAAEQEALKKSKALAKQRALEERIQIKNQEADAQARRKKMLQDDMRRLEKMNPAGAPFSRPANTFPLFTSMATPSHITTMQNNPVIIQQKTQTDVLREIETNTAATQDKLDHIATQVEEIVL